MNTCTHRGTTLCEDREGNSSFLKCYYHAWAFNNSGTLVALPDEAAYGPTFDRDNLALVPAPRFEQYAGFWFMSFDPDIVDLETYLAGAAEYLDLVADQSPEGMTVIPGWQDYSIEANWKLLVENSADGYHGLPLHNRYFEMVMASGASFDTSRSHGADLGNGHAMVMTSGKLGRVPSPELEPLVEERRAELRSRVGDERAARMGGTRNLVIFPNFALVDLVGAVTIRTFYPIRPDYMEVTAWELAPSDEDPRLRRVRADSFNTFWGPAGLATPDDIEALQSCQRGFAAHREAMWSDISRAWGAKQPTRTTRCRCGRSGAAGTNWSPQSHRSPSRTPRSHPLPRRSGRCECGRSRRSQHFHTAAAGARGIPLRRGRAHRCLAARRLAGTVQPGGALAGALPRSPRRPPR